MNKDQTTDSRPLNAPPQDQTINSNHESSDQLTTPKPTTQPKYCSQTSQSTAPTKSDNSTGLIVLQWLTYIFWGGTVIAMSTLTTLVLTFLIIADAKEVGEPSLYVIAAVLVLLPLSVICDFFYSKQEPEKKTGFASILVILYSIFFAFFGVGALVVIAWSIINLLISSFETEGTMIALYSSLIISLLFTLLFLRILLPKKLYKMKRYFIILMVIIVGVICAFGIFGPVAETRLTRNDKLIENNLSTISHSINNYATDNNKLPDNLSSLKLTGDAKKLVTENLVSYKKDSLPTYDYNSSILDNSENDYTPRYPSSNIFYLSLIHI